MLFTLSDNERDFFLRSEKKFRQGVTKAIYMSEMMA